MTVYDGAVYGILDQEKIIKAEVGKTKVETLYTGTCEYLQVTKDGIFLPMRKTTTAESISTAKIRKPSWKRRPSSRTG